MAEVDPRDGVPAAVAARQFCEAFTARDWDLVASTIDEDIHFGVAGTSPLAGEYETRDAFVGLVKRMVELSDDTFHFSRPDAFDVLVSRVHVAILAPFVAKRGDRTLNSYEIWQFHTGERLNGYGSIYPFDLTAFDAFWS